MFTIDDIFSMAVQIESNGSQTYLQAAQQADDTQLTKLLQWMAAEEQAHYRHFETLRRRRVDLSANPIQAEMSRFLMQDMISEHRFGLDQIDFAQIDRVADLLAAMIAFEKDTIAFYSLFQSMLPDRSDQDMIADIIAEERAHVQRLSEYRQRLIEGKGDTLPKAIAR